MAGDLLWDKVALLLPLDGADQSTSFVDESDAGHVFTAYGNAKLSTSEKKFGTASGLFDGTGDYVTCPPSAKFYLGTGNFTIEGWFYESVTGDIRQIIGQHVTDSGQESTCSFLVLSDNGKLTFSAISGGSSTILVNPNTHALNVWHHFAAERVGATIYLYLNGAQVATASIGVSAFNDSTRNLTLGIVMHSTGPAAGNYCFNGRLDDIRITVGAARYGAAFTPPTEAFPIGPVPAAYRIAGKTMLNGVIQPATLRLYEAVTGEFRAEVESDAGTGEYEFAGDDSDDPIVMAAGEEYFILCNYGDGVRPLAHGPITPEVIEP